MYQSVHDAFYDFNARSNFEGYVTWMYLDVAGFVTIGVGNKIDPINLALNLPFEYADQPGSQASQEDITAAWNTVKSRTDLRLSSAFKEVTNLRLTQAAIRSLIDTRLRENENTLKKTLSEFDKFPADAQLGLLSMAWALGPLFINNGIWPKFRAACLNQDWDTAAAECRMKSTNNPGIEPRNDADKTLFSNAARVQELGYAPEVLYYPTVIEREVVVTPSSD